jgi:hypothetical protein
MESKILALVTPVKACLPVAIRESTMPKENRSVQASISFERLLGRHEPRFPPGARTGEHLLGHRMRGQNSFQPQSFRHQLRKPKIRILASLAASRRCSWLVAMDDAL